MYSIISNPNGTREIIITDQHLETIKIFLLFSDLISSHGIITETTLEKLRHNVRSLIDNIDEPSSLINLMSEVLYHPNMKAFGLHQLVTLYLHWTENETQPSSASEIY